MTKIPLSIFTAATPDMSPPQLAEAARQAGLQAIEWRYKDVPEAVKNDPPSFWGNNRCTIPAAWEEADLNAFRDAASRNGLKSLAVMPYLTPGDLAGTERALQAARYLEASFIRLGVYRYDRSQPFTELFELQHAYLKQAEALCRAYGIKGLVETHHMTISSSASAAYRLVEQCDPAHIGVLFDPGNMVFEGYENYRMGMELLGPYLAHVHMKNAGWARAEVPREDGAVSWSGYWTGLTKGLVDWSQVIADLKAVGYGGYIGVEDFSGEHDTAQSLSNFAETVRRLQA